MNPAGLARLPILRGFSADVQTVEGSDSGAEERTPRAQEETTLPATCDDRRFATSGRHDGLKRRRRGDQ
jgi:hypothetical protein